VKICLNPQISVAALGFSLVLLNGFSRAEPSFGSSEFACQVTTSDGGQGLVLVQANSEDKGSEVAASAEQVRTILGNLSKAVAVLECIRHPGGRFKDANFQLFYKDVPL